MICYTLKFVLNLLYKVKVSKNVDDKTSCKNAEYM